MSMADPRRKVMTCRRSIFMSGPSGRIKQSGTMTSMVSGVGPAMTIVPSTGKSIPDGRRRLVDSGSNAKSASSWLNVADTTCTRP